MSWIFSFFSQLKSQWKVKEFDIWLIVGTLQYLLNDGGMLYFYEVWSGIGIWALQNPGVSHRVATFTHHAQEAWKITAIQPKEAHFCSRRTLRSQEITNVLGFFLSISSYFSLVLS